MEPYYEHNGYKVFVTQTRSYGPQAKYIWFRIEDENGNDCGLFDPGMNYLRKKDLKRTIDRLSE